MTITTAVPGPGGDLMAYPGSSVNSEMKISKKKLSRLIDERVDRQLRQRRKKEKELQKQLDEIYALMEDFINRPDTSGRNNRFQEYDD